VIRAFFAVELSQELRAKLATVQQELKRRIEPELKRGTRISWAQPASIHLTIKFLGDMDEQVIDPLRFAVEQAIGSLGSVIVPLERLGVFPHPQSPRVLWVGPSEKWEKEAEAKRVAEIHGAIEQACEALGFLRETRPFSPHLTLARIKMGERYVGVALAKGGVLDRPLSLGSLAVESVVLIKSELKPTGSIYTKLWEVRMRAD
jgi:2'-5' RNA ligase